MLLTATASRKIAEEVLRGVRKINPEETEPVKGDFVEEFDEITFISKMIQYQRNHGKIIYEFDFRISDNTSEILKTMLYPVIREESKTTVAW